jgi:hypothetical protein
LSGKPALVILLTGRQPRGPPNKKARRGTDCFVKNLFWEEEEVVMQLHPATSQYVNYHPNCLHLWRPMHMSILHPPSILVGPK